MSDIVAVEYTTWVRDELKQIPGEQAARVLRRVDMLPAKGWQISVRDGDVVQLHSGIWELRITGKGPAYRVLFFVEPRNPGRLVVLTTCAPKGLLKKKSRLEAEVKRALTRRSEWLRAKEEDDEQQNRTNQR
jgi:putative component of toxin-antitoxin plasmid stabilization module